uniref:Uncharacterized protein n=1 Tax=Octopus bimaculoides TaxID=37653 RepID=A0A0L8FS05_OCTBM
MMISSSMLEWLTESVRNSNWMSQPPTCSSVQFLFKILLQTKMQIYIPRY